MSAARVFFMIAGEPSGDRLGASLMAALKVQNPGVEFHGIGGPLMQAEGLSSLFPMSELSIMGILEVLPKLRGLLARVRQAAAAAVDLAPDALITIDSPDFCLRVAAKVKAADPDLKTIHYVAPTVWAWRPERAVSMARHIDHVLALFPFEPKLMHAAGMGCDFVGHPVVSDIQPDVAAISKFRASYNIAPDQQLIAVLPGSRRGEITRMGPVFAKVLARLEKHDSTLRYIIPAARNIAEPLAEMVKSWPGQAIFLDPRGLAPAKAETQKNLSFAAADLALATSGTVSLELAAAQTPMVIAYQFNWLTTKIIKRKALIDTATLVNILTGTKAVPEFLFEACTAENITPCLQNLLADPKARQAQIEAGGSALAMLGAGTMDPGAQAAQAVLATIGA